MTSVHVLPLLDDLTTGLVLSVAVSWVTELSVHVPRFVFQARKKSTNPSFWVGYFPLGSGCLKGERQEMGFLQVAESDKEQTLPGLA